MTVCGTCEPPGASRNATGIPSWTRPSAGKRSRTWRRSRSDIGREPRAEAPRRQPLPHVPAFGEDGDAPIAVRAPRRPVRVERRLAVEDAVAPAGALDVEPVDVLGGIQTELDAERHVVLVLPRPPRAVGLDQHVEVLVERVEPRGVALEGAFDVDV